MKKQGGLAGMIFLLIAILVLVGSWLYFSGLILNNNKELIPLEQLQTNFNDGKACFNQETTNNCFDIAIEKDDLGRNTGLMFNKGIRNDQGMLFVFEGEGEHGMWMKNMIIPLDMMWINSEGIIVFTAHDIEPCSKDFCPTITNDVDAKYVLEMNAGILSQKEIKVGDKVTIRINNL